MLDQLEFGDFESDGETPEDIASDEDILKAELELSGRAPADSGDADDDIESGPERNFAVSKDEHHHEENGGDFDEDLGKEEGEEEYV